MRTSRTHDAAFKAKVALEVVKEKTLSQRAGECGVWGRREEQDRTGGINPP